MKRSLDGTRRLRRYKTCLRTSTLGPVALRHAATCRILHLLNYRAHEIPDAPLGLMHITCIGRITSRAIKHVDDPIGLLSLCPDRRKPSFEFTGANDKNSVFLESKPSTPRSAPWQLPPSRSHNVQRMSRSSSKCCASLRKPVEHSDPRRRRAQAYFPVRAIELKKVGTVGKL